MDVNPAVHLDRHRPTDLCVLKVMPPQRSDLVLSTNVPYGKANVLVFHCFHIKPYKQSAFTLLAATAISYSQSRAWFDCATKVPLQWAWQAFATLEVVGSSSVSNLTFAHAIF